MKTIRINSSTVISRDLSTERYLKDIRNTKPLTKEEERSLIKEAQAGDINAANKLVLANLKFVVMVAKEYQTPGFEIMDLISAGNLGLHRAIFKFNLKQENINKFISYAVWHIKTVIIEFLKDNSKTIHLPYNQLENINQLEKEREKLEKELQQPVAIDSIVFGKVEETKDNIRNAILCHLPAYSLEHTIDSSDESGSTLGDTIFDKDLPEYEFDSDKEFKKALLINSLETLTTLQKQVIVYSFGLYESLEYSNQDIATKLNLTPERVRQIKEKALLRLKDSELIKKYKNTLC